jgi:hypothetical protein
MLMRMMSPQDFIAENLEASTRPPGEIDLARYQGTAYPCACGRMHILDDSVELLRQLDSPEPRVVLACPDLGRQALTLVQFRQGFGTRALSEMGSRFEGDLLGTRHLQTG